MTLILTPVGHIYKPEEKGNGDDEQEKESEDFNIDPKEAQVWKESEIVVYNLVSKFSSILTSYSH